MSKKPVCGVITETELHGQKTIHISRIMGKFAALNAAAKESGFFTKVVYGRFRAGRISALFTSSDFRQAIG